MSELPLTDPWFTLTRDMDIPELTKFQRFIEETRPHANLDHRDTVAALLHVFRVSYGPHSEHARV